MEKVRKTTLGPVHGLEIKSSIGISYVLQEYKTIYPDAVVHALQEIYDEYSQAFTHLVKTNMEWDTDYMYCFNDGIATNFFVQIDMVGLTDDFLSSTDDLSLTELKLALKGKIFEIENSLAGYQAMETYFCNSKGVSFFKTQFRQSLMNLRRKFGKKVALLAVTDQKYISMKEVEFGKKPEESLSDSEIIELSGFDTCFGPNEFLEYLEKNNGVCGYLLYVRSSDPTDKLKDPTLVIEHPLLVKPEIRRVIKQNSIMLSIDNPEWTKDDPKRINDTKEYLISMGMAFRCDFLEDIFSEKFIEHLSKGKPYAEYLGNRFSDKFASYIKTHVIDVEKKFRFKPLKGTYGGYGQFRGNVSDSKIRRELKNNIKKRGSYIIQPEMEIPTIKIDTEEYIYIDRNFFTTTDGQFTFLGGERTMLPTTSEEAKQGRVHRNKNAVYAEIVCG